MRLTLDRLRELLEYDCDSGLFVRRFGIRGHRTGEVVGTINKHLGYAAIMIDGELFYGHRLAWFYMTGEWPKHQIDHINLNKSDNRWMNLREATVSQNRANRIAQSNNTSGLKWVSWCKRREKWRATVADAHVGYFNCPAAAHLRAFVEADKAFGEYARAA